MRDRLVAVLKLAPIVLAVLAPQLARADGRTIEWKPFDRHEADARCTSLKNDGLPGGGLLGTEAAPPPKLSTKIIGSAREWEGACAPAGVDFKRSILVELNVPTSLKISVTNVARVGATLRVTVEHAAWCNPPLPPPTLDTKYVLVARGPRKVTVVSTYAKCPPTP